MCDGVSAHELRDPPQLEIAGAVAYICSAALRAQASDQDTEVALCLLLLVKVVAVSRADPRLHLQTTRLPDFTRLFRGVSPQAGRFSRARENLLIYCGSDACSWSAAPTATAARCGTARHGYQLAGSPEESSSLAAAFTLSGLLKLPDQLSPATPAEFPPMRRLAAFRAVGRSRLRHRLTAFRTELR